eukprot:1484735-Pyramimonas_sp.AAC.1
MRLIRARGYYTPRLLGAPSLNPGISSRPCSNWFPPRVYSPVPAPIGSRPGDILPSLLRLVPAPGISSRPCPDWFPLRGYPPVPAPIGSRTGVPWLVLVVASGLLFGFLFFGKRFHGTSSD